MEIIFWIIVFVLSLLALIKGSDLLIFSSEKIGRAIGLNTFVIGAVVVGIGTSLPELISSLLAVLKGANEIVNSNAIGSNIANILLIIGIASVLSKKLVVEKELIDIDLPLLGLSTVLYLLLAIDGKITPVESVILLISFIIYMAYSLIFENDNDKKTTREKINVSILFKLIVGVAGLLIGANYIVESVVTISEILSIAVSAISITAVAVGTSLPELVVSARAALKGKSGIAIGNIFGSNSFNLLVVVGLPGLFSTLYLDQITLNIGLIFLVVSTFMFVISGISKRIHIWEGFMFLMIYLVFILKLFSLI